MMTYKLSSNKISKIDHQIDWERLTHAIHMVETGGRTGPVLGDSGNALGPLQIHRAYHIDSRVSFVAICVVMLLLPVLDALLRHKM